MLKVGCQTYTWEMLGADWKGSVDDMLDDLAELVLTKGGEVVVVPSERMPTDSGLAAICRF